MLQCFSFLCIANCGFHFSYSRHPEILVVLFIIILLFSAMHSINCPVLRGYENWQGFQVDIKYTLNRSQDWAKVERISKAKYFQ